MSSSQPAPNPAYETTPPEALPAALAPLERPLVVPVDPPHDIEKLHQRMLAERALVADLVTEGAAKVKASDRGLSVRINERKVTGRSRDQLVLQRVNASLSAHGYGPRLIGARAASPAAPAGPGPCPECRAGKHGNCDGRTWDEAADDYATCPCNRAGHQ